MNRLLNIIKLHSELGRSGEVNSKIGLVDSVDPVNYCAKVLLEPEEYLTGWIPIGAEWVGNGWGLVCPPTPGDMVLIEFVEGNIEAGIITKRLYSNEDRPVSAGAGEIYIVHQSGSAIKLTSDGKLLLVSTTEIDAGDVAGTLLALVTSAFMDIYNNHGHGQDGLPTLKMTTAHLTTILRAN